MSVTVVPEVEAGMAVSFDSTTGRVRPSIAEPVIEWVRSSDTLVHALDSVSAWQVASSTSEGEVTVIFVANRTTGSGLVRVTLDSVTGEMRSWAPLGTFSTGPLVQSDVSGAFLDQRTLRITSKQGLVSTSSPPVTWIEAEGGTALLRLGVPAGDPVSVIPLRGIRSTPWMVPIASGLLVVGITSLGEIERGLGGQTDKRPAQPTIVHLGVPGGTPINATHPAFSGAPVQQTIAFRDPTQRFGRTIRSGAYIWTFEPREPVIESNRLGQSRLVLGLLSLASGTWTGVRSLPVPPDTSVWGVVVDPVSGWVQVGTNRTTGEHPPRLLVFSSEVLSPTLDIRSRAIPVRQRTWPEARSGASLVRLINGDVAAVLMEADGQASLEAIGINAPDRVRWSRQVSWQINLSSQSENLLPPALSSEPTTGTLVFAVACRAEPSSSLPSINDYGTPNIDVVGLHPDTGDILWSRGIRGLNVRGSFLNALFAGPGLWSGVTSAPTLPVTVLDTARDRALANLPAAFPNAPSTLPLSERWVLIRSTLRFPEFNGISLSGSRVAWSGSTLVTDKGIPTGSRVGIQPLTGVLFTAPAGARDEHNKWIGRDIGESRVLVL